MEVELAAFSGPLSTVASTTTADTLGANDFVQNTHGGRGYLRIFWSIY